MELALAEVGIGIGGGATIELEGGVTIDLEAGGGIVIAPEDPTDQNNCLANLMCDNGKCNVNSGLGCFRKPIRPHFFICWIMLPADLKN